MTRTSDLRFRKPSLYPPELRGRAFLPDATAERASALRVIVEQRSYRRISQLRTPGEEVQLHEEPVSRHRCPATPDELPGGGGRSSRREQVVDDERSIPGSKGVRVDLQRGLAVLEVVRLAQRRSTGVSPACEAERAVGDAGAQDRLRGRIRAPRWPRCESSAGPANSSQSASIGARKPGPAGAKGSSRRGT